MEAESLPAEEVVESWEGVLQTVQGVENRAEEPKAEVQSAVVALTPLQEKFRGMSC